MGGSRIAWSYLVGLAAVVAAALPVAAAAPLVETACSAQESALCNVGWLLVVGAVSLVACLAVAAWVARLGWEWWLLLTSIVLGAPLWAVGSVGEGLVVPALVAPGLAGLVTWHGPGRPRWRPWLVAATAAALLGGSAWAVAGG